jgi:hypothetical protein
MQIITVTISPCWIVILSVHFNLRYILILSGEVLDNVTDCRNTGRIFFSPGATQPIVGVYFTALYRALASSRMRLLDHIQRRATVGRTPLNE